MRGIAADAVGRASGTSSRPRTGRVVIHDGLVADASNPLANVEKYRPIRELGRGGMGVVYLCEHAVLGTKIVVKLLHKELASRKLLVERMRLEAQALALLRHPNLVRVHDFDRTPEGQPYFVMEHLPGTPLKDFVQERGGSLPVAEALAYARQALEGLAYAHDQQLVHRDIKLDNLFLCDAVGEDGRRLLKILDFGVAKLLQESEGGPEALANPTGTGMVVGTPRFFAPEQARGKKLDHRADLYSMGLCIFVMVAGRGPFDDCRTLVEIAKAHVARVPDPPSKLARQPIPRELDELVLACVAKDPDDRPRSAREVIERLRAIEARLAGGPSASVVGGIASQNTEAISEELWATLSAPARAGEPRAPGVGGAAPFGGQPIAVQPYAAQAQPAGYAAQPCATPQYGAPQYAAQAQPAGYAAQQYATPQYAAPQYAAQPQPAGYAAQPYATPQYAAPQYATPPQTAGYASRHAEGTAQGAAGAGLRGDAQDGTLGATKVAARPRGNSWVLPVVVGVCVAVASGVGVVLFLR